MLAIGETPVLRYWSIGTADFIHRDPKLVARKLFCADDARARTMTLNVFGLVQSSFVARMQQLPRLSDTALTVTLPILAVLGRQGSPQILVSNRTILGKAAVHRNRAKLQD